MKKALLASAACAALGLASVAQAAVTVSYVNKGQPSSSAGSPAGYTGWVVRLVSDSGNISGVDYDAQGRGIFAPLVQRWTSSGGDGTFDTPSAVNTNQNTGTSVLNLDSHILPPGGNAANILSAVPPNEDNNTAGVAGFPANTDSAAFGVGTFMKGAFGIAGAAQSTTYDLAYLVLPNSFTGEAGLGQLSVSTAGGTFAVPLPPIPEPATLSLAGLAGLGVLARRRRG